MELLAEHNRRVREKKRTAAKYVPMKHSMKDVKGWERISGKKWYSLGPREREIANKEIDQYLRQKRATNNTTFDNINTNGKNNNDTATTSNNNTHRMKNNSRMETKKRKISSATNQFRLHASNLKYVKKNSNNNAHTSASSKKTRRISDVNKNSNKNNKNNRNTSISKEEIDLLAAHNRRIRRKSGKKSTYEPLKHRMSDVKMWERKSGKRYYDLNPGEREQANLEITKLLNEINNKKNIKENSHSSNHNNSSSSINDKKKKKRRPSLSDVYRTQIDSNIFNFHTPASVYKDIDSILKENNFDSIHDAWFQTPHDEILNIPESLR
jgi:hypothetical protein